MTPELITSSGQMAALQSRLADTPLIAVDTEFFRETSYYPELALVQIATDNIIACIDPLAFDARQALADILLDKDITKIFHSCSQDLEVLYYYLGEIPTNIYDTQLAYALLSEHQQIGYASMVEQQLGVTLDKSQTRTNWLQRPLTDKQIQYAGDDVFYLYQLHHRMESQLKQAGRKDWFDEDSQLLNETDNNFLPDTSKLWKRVKGANRLNRQKLAMVQAIAIWREDLAQKKNRTRRRVFPDDALIDLACSAPVDEAALQQRIATLRFNAQEKQSLLQAIRHAQQSNADSWPDNRFIALDNTQKALLKQLQQILSNKAEQLSIASAVLGSRKDLETLIINHGDSPLKTATELKISHGWRYQCIGKQLLETIKNTI